MYNVVFIVFFHKKNPYNCESYIGIVLVKTKAAVPVGTNFLSDVYVVTCRTVDGLEEISFVKVQSEAIFVGYFNVTII